MKEKYTRILYKGRDETNICTVYSHNHYISVYGTYKQTGRI